MDTIKDRFYSKVDQRGPDECWLWTAGTFSDGYGQFSVHGHSVRAHRFAYQLAHGPIPAGMQVCHHCDNRRCVNPEHLFLGTTMDNLRDARRKGRMPKRATHGRAKLTEAQVHAIRQRYEAGESQYALARVFGVHASAIGKIVRYDNWAEARHDPPPERCLGEGNYNARLTEERVRAIRKRYAAGESQYALARAYGVSRSAIKNVVNHCTWKHVV
jgi:hypothetical protein